MDIINIARQFQTDSTPVSAVSESGGHINDTWRVTAASGTRYILQSINASVMKNPPRLMENIAAVTRHLRKKGVPTLTVIPTDGDRLCLECGGKFYRMYLFVENARCRLAPECEADFEGAGAAFGAFIQALDDMPLGTTYITPKASHNTLFHFSRLKRVIQADPQGRAAAVEEEIRAAMSRRAYADIIRPLMVQGRLPVRIVHNDSKYSNIMMDHKTHTVRCILDLDNVMPGSLLYDYGDSIRSGCDRDGVFDEGLMAAYTRGFLSAITPTPLEMKLLPLAPLIITYENAIRYLTDYLEGETYFKTEYPGQNLDKFKKRMTLLKDMEKKLF